MKDRGALRQIGNGLRRRRAGGWKISTGHMAERIDIAVANAVAEVRLNRPDKLNALDMAMFDALAEAGDRLAREKGIRAVILAGNGRSFSVGIDLDALRDQAGSRLADLGPRTHGDCNLFQHVAMQWRGLPMPVIAAVHGHALGGGFQLMLGADIRIIAPDARLSLREAFWGLVPDMAGFPLMRGLVRDDIARDLIFSAREFSGQEALSLGIATRVEADPLAAARDLAQAMAGLSPDALRAAKRLFNASSAGASDAELLLAESKEQTALLNSANHRERILAYREKRPPVFSD